MTLVLKLKGQLFYVNCLACYAQEHTVTGIGHSLVDPTGQVPVFPSHQVIGHDAAAHLVGDKDHDFAAVPCCRQQLIDFTVDLFTAVQKVHLVRIRSVFAIE